MQTWWISRLVALNPSTLFCLPSAWVCRHGSQRTREQKQHLPCVRCDPRLHCPSGMEAASSVHRRGSSRPLRSSMLGWGGTAGVPGECQEKAFVCDICRMWWSVWGDRRLEDPSRGIYPGSRQLLPVLQGLTHLSSRSPACLLRSSPACAPLAQFGARLCPHGVSNRSSHGEPRLLF